MENEKDELPPVSVGDKLLLRGTGYWSEGVYPCTVVDIRDGDNTIKVQYSDGRYKRFASIDFNELRVSSSAEEELSVMDLVLEDVDKMEKLDSTIAELKYRESVAEALREKDYKKAAALKRQFMEERGRYLEYLALDGKLRLAVLREDFEAAHNIQTQIKAYEEGQAKRQNEQPSISALLVLQQAAGSAFRGGLAGAAAMVIQVSSLMWMRTIMNYQYKNGGTTKQAFNTLWAEGGVRRLYRGLAPALLQGPLSRFGDTAANAGIMALLENNSVLRSAPPVVKTVFSSASAALFRICLMPIDTLKTTMQVQGADGMKNLGIKMRQGGPTVLFHGAIGASAATFAGHYPWFATYNSLQSFIPHGHNLSTKLLRNAGIGFVSSAVSDTISNSLRVLKTYRQTSETKVSYKEAAQLIIAKDGMIGLFGRGLQTRLLTNGMQGMMFSVLWKFFEDTINRK